MVNSSGQKDTKQIGDLLETGDLFGRVPATGTRHDSAQPIADLRTLAMTLAVKLSAEGAVVHDGFDGASERY